MARTSKVLEISTAHIPQEIAQAIDGGYFSHKPAMSRPEGWLFSVPPKDDPLGEGITSKAFEHLMDAARFQECDWLLFDRDEAQSELFPTFDW